MDRRLPGHLRATIVKRHACRRLLHRRQLESGRRPRHRSRRGCPYGKNQMTWDPIRGPTTRLPSTGAGNAWSKSPPTPNVILVFIPPAAPSRLFRRPAAGDNQMGQLRRRAQSIHRELSGASRSSITISGITMSPRSQLSSRGKRYPRHRRHHKNGPRLRSSIAPTALHSFPSKKNPFQKNDIGGEESWPTQPSAISAFPKA